MIATYTVHWKEQIDDLNTRYPRCQAKLNKGTGILKF